MVNESEMEQEPTEQPTEARGRRYTREQVVNALPSAVGVRRTREDATGTIGSAPLGERVSGGQVQALSTRWLTYMSPTVGLRGYLLGLVRQQDADAADAYERALKWMDKYGYPPRSQVDLPDGLLLTVATALEVSERTVQRRLTRAEEIMATLSITFS